MDEKMIILSSHIGGVNGNSTYSYTLMIGDLTKINKVTRDELTKKINSDYPDLKLRIKNHFENFADCPPELARMDPTPKEQLIKSVLEIPVIVIASPEEKTPKIATGIHTVGFENFFERDEKEFAEKYEEEDIYAHFKNNSKKKRRR